MIELDPEQRQAIEDGGPGADHRSPDARCLRAGPGRGLRAASRGTGADLRSKRAPQESTPPDEASLDACLLARSARTARAATESQEVGHIPGDEHVAIARSQVDAYQECFRRGLQRGEFSVGWLRADPEGIPPWGSVRGSDWSFYRSHGREFHRRRMKILDRLPIPGERTSLRLGDRFVTVHRDQILVWVSVHLSGVPRTGGRTSRGFRRCWTRGTISGSRCRIRHLLDWAGIGPDLLEPIRGYRGQRAGRQAAESHGLAIPERPRAAGCGRRAAGHSGWR